MPALSVVVGLILAFRTNTAYDRFWEGRKLWASLDVQIRNFSRMIWVGVKDTRHVHEGSSSSSSGSSPKRNLLHSHLLFGRSSSSLKMKVGANGNGNVNGYVESRVQNVSSSTLIDIDSPPTLQQQVDTEVHEDDYEKVVVIRLLLAFAVSVKHHLRQEFGVRYFDLEGLLPADYEPCATYESAETRLAHDKVLGDRHRNFNEDMWNIVSGNEEGQMSLPLEIAHGLSLWVIAQSRASQIESALVGNLFSSINSMTDIFTNMERIVFTPIPLAYSIHL